MDGQTRSTRQDTPLLLLLFVAGLLALSVLFGVELAISKYIADFRPIYVALGAAFVLATWAFTTLQRRQRIAPRIQIASGVTRRRSPEAPGEVADAIRARAVGVGISVPLEVRYLEGSQHEPSNAEVFRDGKAFVIALTIRMLVDYCKPAESLERQRFEFIVDHELGHIAHRDVALMPLAYSIFVMFVVFLPIKMVLIFWIYPSFNYYLLDLAQLFPAITSGGEIFTSFSPPGSATLIAFQVAVILTGAGLILSIIYLIRLRREVLADQFAVAHAKEREKALSVLRAQFAAPAKSTISSVSFVGGLRTHPLPERRVLRAGAEGGSKFEDIEVAIGFVALLVLIRVLLGKVSNYSLLADDLSFIAAATLNIVLCTGFVSLHLGADDGTNLVRLLHRGATVIALGIIGALAIVFVDLGARAIGPGPEDKIAELVIGLETTELQILAASFPICLLALVIGCIVTNTVFRKLIGQRCPLLIQSLGGAITGLLLMHAAADFLSPHIESRRERVIVDVRNHYEAVLMSRPDCLDIERIREDDCKDQWYAWYVREELPKQVDFEPFLPPLAWFYLWMQPFLRPGHFV